MQLYQRSPLEELHISSETCVPIGIFGDDAGVFSSQKVRALLWGSVAVKRLTLDSRILFSAITYAPHRARENTYSAVQGPRVVFELLGIGAMANT